MSYDNDPVEPQVALSQFLNVIKSHADSNQEFRDDLLRAIGVAVLYAGEDDLTNVPPHIVAAQKGELKFRAIYGTLGGPKIRTILVTKSKLASKADAAGKSAEELLDMLWKRSYNKALELGLAVAR
jgi:hypothetical protein